MEQSLFIFQFLYGAIEGVKEDFELSLNGKFQFLYGAIEGYHHRSQLQQGNQFQFLYGAIEGSSVKEGDLTIS